MNSTISLATVELARLRDRAAARSEWDAEFRSDLESVFGMEVLEGLTISGRYELPPVPGTSYVAFTDPSGGQSDSFTLGIAHQEKRGVVVLDAIREVIPPFSPEAVVKEYCDLLRAYRINEVCGDRYAAGWSAEQFLKNGVNYRPSERSKSEIYLSFLPMVMSGQVELLDHKKLLNQLVDLERRTRSGGRDSVDHSAGAHDDIANAAAGAIVRALGDTVLLTWAAMLNALVEKFGGKWRDFIGKDDDPAEEPKSEVPAPANGRQVFSENASVMKARAALNLGLKCPQCGSTCVVRRGLLFHCNSDGFEFPVPGAAVEAAQGQRREALLDLSRRGPQNFRSGR